MLDSHTTDLDYQEQRRTIESPQTKHVFFPRIVKLWPAPLCLWLAATLCLLWLGSGCHGEPIRGRAGVTCHHSVSWPEAAVGAALLFRRLLCGPLAIWRPYENWGGSFQPRSWLPWQHNRHGDKVKKSGLAFQPRSSWVHCRRDSHELSMIKNHLKPIDFI